MKLAFETLRLCKPFKHHAALKLEALYNVPSYDRAVHLLPIGFPFLLAAVGVASGKCSKVESFGGVGNDGGVDQGVSGEAAR